MSEGNPGLKAALHSLGCKVNSYETQAMEEALRNAGYEIVDFEDMADVYVINTCTVTSVSDKKSRQMIRRAKKHNPAAIVVACGCFAQQDVDSKAYECDIILGNNHKSDIINAINSFNEQRAPRARMAAVSDLSHRGTLYESMSLALPASHTRGFIKVQDGCDRFCTYCIIPLVRGRSRSRDIEDIRKEAKSYADNGCSEVVLCGVNLSDYSFMGAGLEDIISVLEETEGIRRIRLGSLEPDVFDDRFVSRLSGFSKLCPHFHISLQSGCDRTLSSMNRHYLAKDMTDAAKRLRESFESPALCADVIAGFAGESEEDFRESFELIKSIGFYELHVFPYSERANTAAFGRKDQVPLQIRQERAHRLLELSKSTSIDYIRSHLGRQCEVLFEELIDIRGKQYYTGFTREYIRVYCESNVDLRGKILSVRLDEIFEEGCRAV